MSNEDNDTPVRPETVPALAKLPKARRQLPEGARATQFKPGISGNPSGRPRGTSLTARLRDKLDEPAPGEPGKVLADVIADRLIELATDKARPDRAAIELILAHVDGKPHQSVSITADASKLF